MRSPKRPNILNNVLEEDETVTAPRNSRSKARAAAKPARNSRTAAKATPAKAGKGKTTNRNSSVARDTNNSGKRAKRDFSEMEIEFELDRETKNKLMYIELDESGDKVEAFRGGRIGQIYLLKDDCGRNPPERIKVIIQEA